MANLKCIRPNTNLRLVKKTLLCETASRRLRKVKREKTEEKLSQGKDEQHSGKVYNYLDHCNSWQEKIMYNKANHSLHL